MSSIPVVARAMRSLVRKPVCSSRVSLAGATRAFTSEQQVSSSTTSASPPPPPPAGVEGLMSSNFQQSRAAYHQSEEAALRYVSPYQELFDAMHADAPGVLGETEEEVEFEKNQQVKRMQCGIPEHVVRFTTTSYGRTLAPPHVMPNEHRVIAKVNTRYLPLTDVEMEILKEIVGNRLNLQRNVLQLQSNQFGSRIENKRHLVSMMDRIILSCQRLGRELQDEAKMAEADQETAQ